MRETVAVADLIPGDIIIPSGHEVVGYPHGAGSLPGTAVRVDRGNGVIIGEYFPDPETQVNIIRD